MIFDGDFDDEPARYAILLRKALFIFKSFDCIGFFQHAKKQYYYTADAWEIICNASMNYLLCNQETVDFEADPRFLYSQALLDFESYDGFGYYENAKVYKLITSVILVSVELCTLNSELLKRFGELVVSCNEAETNTKKANDRIKKLFLKPLLRRYEAEVKQHEADVCAGKAMGAFKDSNSAVYQELARHMRTWNENRKFIKYLQGMSMWMMEAFKTTNWIS
jgi:hypothetical protein